MRARLRDGQFSDFTLRVGGAELRLHRVVLAQFSKFFERLFAGSWRDSTEMDLDLAPLGISLAGLRLTLEYVYGLTPHFQEACAAAISRGVVPDGWRCPDLPDKDQGRCKYYCRILHLHLEELLERSMPELLEMCTAATYLEIKELQWQTQVALGRNLAPTTVAELFRYCEEHDGTAWLREACTHWMLHHFRDVVLTAPEALEELPAAWLAALLNDDRLWVADDLERYLCAVAVLRYHHGSPAGGGDDPPPGKKRRATPHNDGVTASSIAAAVFKGFEDWNFPPNVRDYLYQQQQVPLALLFGHSQSQGPDRWHRVALRVAFHMLSPTEAIATRFLTRRPANEVAAGGLEVMVHNAVHATERSLLVKLHPDVTVVVHLYCENPNVIEMRVANCHGREALEAGLVLHRRNGTCAGYFGTAASDLIVDFDPLLEYPCGLLNNCVLGGWSPVSPDVTCSLRMTLWLKQRYNAFSGQTIMEGAASPHTRP